MAQRKTINVQEVKDWANQQFESTIRWNKETNEYEEVDAAWREGVQTMLENILMSTDNYKGFRYLREDEVPEKALPGIRETESGFGKSIEELEDIQFGRFENTDRTRVRYF
jgi:hypothetical protein